MSSMPRHAGHTLLAAVLASALAAASAQQPSPAGSYYDDSGQQQVSTAMVALLAAVVAVFVFIAASTVFLRHCSGYATSSSRSPAAGDGRGVVVIPNLDALLISQSWWQRRRGGPRGLHAEVIEAFPTMTYAEAKALRVGNKGGAATALECAVCLSEFEDGERLRLLLPKCSHAFHPDCIGEWLAGHVTCPVCRCNLEPNKDSTSSDAGEQTSFPPTIPLASSVSSETAMAAWQVDDGPVPVAVVIDVVTAEEEEEARRQEALELQRIGTQRRAMRSRSGLRSTTTTQLPRWHSTGHSLPAQLDRDLERFTLRLPEHVRREMVAASEHSLQLRRARRAGAEEASARSAPLGRLARWRSLLGSLSYSVKLSSFSASRVTATSAGGGEVPSSSLSSYTRLRGKRVAAVDVVDDVPAKGSGAEAGAASREVAAVADEEKTVKHAVVSDVE